MLTSLFGSSPTMKLTFNEQDSLPTVRIPSDDDRQVDKLYLFASDQTVGAVVEIILPPNIKRLEHNGIRAELIGQIELAYDRGNHYVFCSSSKELTSAGVLTQDTKYNFEFKDEKDNNGEKKYESYDGINVRLRYFIRIRISRSYGASAAKEFDFAVQKNYTFS